MEILTEHEVKKGLRENINKNCSKQKEVPTFRDQRNCLRCKGIYYTLYHMRSCKVNTTANIMRIFRFKSAGHEKNAEVTQKLF